MYTGILGMNKKESVGAGSGDLTIESMIECEELYAEALELGHEAHMDAIRMGQGIAVAERLEDQAVLATEAMANPELVTSATAAYARESMALAMTALGAPTTGEAVCTTESIQASPVNALDVTTESIKSTAKKVWNAIKMVFQRIGLAMKKLVVKLVVVMNRTGKKAEKMLKNFKADKAATPKEGKLTGKDGDRAQKLGMAMKLVNDEFKVTADEMKANMAAIVDFADSTSDDAEGLQALVDAKAAAKDNPAALVASIFTIALLKDKLKSPKAVALFTGSAVKLGSGTKAATGSVAKKSIDDHLSGDVESESRSVLYPLYVKGVHVICALFYMEKLEDDDKENAIAALRAQKYQIVRIDASEDVDLKDDIPVMSRGEIEAKLTEAKKASKQLDSASKKAMTSIDKLMKQIDKVAAKKSGPAFLNRFIKSEYSSMRVLVANTYLDSVLAMASDVRNDLRVTALHMADYSDQS